MTIRPTLDLAAAPGDRTAAIQAAIDHIAACGGGTVSLLAGVHDSGGLRLRSHTHLHLAAGAVLRAASDYDAFADTVSGSVAEDSDRVFLLARDVQDVRISGPGTLHGRGDLWCSEIDPASGARVPKHQRPRMIVVEDSADVTLDGVTIRRSPMWTVHLIASRRLHIRDIIIDNDMAQPNTDGIVIDSCEDVDVENASIRAADDSIVLKTCRRLDGAPRGACRRVRVRRARTSSRGCSFKIGTETHGDIEDVVFEDCEAIETNRGLGIFSRDGGAIRNIRFQRIRLTCRETPVGYWGTGEAIALTVVDRRPDTRLAGEIRDVVIEDISGSMQGAINIVSLGSERISGVRIDRVALTQAPGPLGHGRCCDLRPTPADITPPPGAIGRANAWFCWPDGRVVGYHAYPEGLPAIYLQNAPDVGLGDVRITRPEPLPSNWNPEPLVRVAAGFAAF